MNKRQRKKFMKYRIDPLKEFGSTHGKLIQNYINIISNEVSSAKRKNRKPGWLKEKDKSMCTRDLILYGQTCLHVVQTNDGGVDFEHVPLKKLYECSEND